MRPPLRLLVSVLLAGALSPAQPAAAADSEPRCPELVWRTLLRSSLKDRMLVSKLETLLAVPAAQVGVAPDDKAAIIVAVADLGGDPRREMAVRLDGHAFCSAQGCAMYILRKGSSGHWAPVAQFAGQQLSTTPTRTNGFCDLLLLGPQDSATRWRWSGERYEAAAAPATPAAPEAGGTR
ncbi:MAG: hypothetical protein ABI629_17555 [bacterium]